MAFGVAGAAAGASNALQDVLARAFAQRQAEQQMALQQQAGGRADAQLRLQQQQIEAANADRDAARGDLATEREFRRASLIAENAVPDDAVDASTADLLTKHGFGGQVRTIQLQPVQGALQNDPSTGEVPQYDVTPGETKRTLRGGQKWLTARATAEERAASAAEVARVRAEQAEAERLSREEIARQADETRRTVAGMAASGRSETAGLRNQLTQLQIDQAREKQEQAQKETARQAQSVTDSAQLAIGLIDRLTTHPGVGSITGAYEMRGFTPSARDAASIRDQVVAQLTLPNLGSLKGPMSDKDVQFVKSISTRLSAPGISEKEFRQALTEARQRLAGVGANVPPGAEAATGIQEWTRDAQGRPVPVTR